MDVLYPAIHIENSYFSGKLLIDGDFKDNCILFRFLFDNEEMVHPLIIWVKVMPIDSPGNKAGKQNENGVNILVFKCNISDINNPVMKTRLIFPDFLLKEHKIEVIRIESQISYRP